MTNEEIARRLRQEASNRSRTGDTLYRVRALRQAAMAVLALPEPVEAILSRGGRRELRAVPGIGRGLARRIDELTRPAPNSAATTATRGLPKRGESPRQLPSLPRPRRTE